MKTEVIIYDDSLFDALDEDGELDEPIPFVPVETPTVREGLHFTPDDEYGYGT